MSALAALSPSEVEANELEERFVVGPRWGATAHRWKTRRGYTDSKTTAKMRVRYLKSWVGHEKELEAACELLGVYVHRMGAIEPGCVLAGIDWCAVERNGGGRRLQLVIPDNGLILVQGTQRPTVVASFLARRLGVPVFSAWQGSSSFLRGREARTLPPELVVLYHLIDGNMPYTALLSRPSLKGAWERTIQLCHDLWEELAPGAPSLCTELGNPYAPLVDLAKLGLPIRGVRDLGQGRLEVHWHHRESFAEPTLGESKTTEEAAHVA